MAAEPMSPYMNFSSL